MTRSDYVSRQRRAWWTEKLAIALGTVLTMLALGIGGFFR